MKTIRVVDLFCGAGGASEALRRACAVLGVKLELARAMSFGDDYQFAGNQGDKVKQIGNAWPCKLGQALIETLLHDYAAKKKPGRLEAIA